MSEHPGAGQAGSEPAGADRPTFPSYEEFASDLLEAVDAVGLSIEDVRHHLEPGLGERRFECTVRLTGEPPPRYHVHVSYTWDALLTFISAYGPGADCELYHDDDEAQDCPHQQITPQAFVDVEAEFVLGDGGYELHDLDEVGGWVETVQSLLGKAFSEDDKPSVHVGIAVLGTTTLVEKFTAEHSWFLDFEKQPDLATLAKQIELGAQAGAPAGGSPSHLRASSAGRRPAAASSSRSNGRCSSSAWGTVKPGCLTWISPRSPSMRMSASAIRGPHGYVRRRPAATSAALQWASHRAGDHAAGLRSRTTWL